MENNNGQQETAARVARALEDIRMDASLAGLNTDLHAMVGQIRYMNGNVAGMANSIQVMNNQINNMNLTIGYMGENIRQLAKPVKAFPSEIMHTRAQA
jgi:hypothetical protein